MIDDSLQFMGGTRCFSVMYLDSGYWQANLSPEDRDKCALISTEGLFEPTCMPLGLFNAPVTFQRSINNLLGYLKMYYVLLYLNNINTFSFNFQDHLVNLWIVFNCLRLAGLKLKPSKCSSFK